MAWQAENHRRPALLRRERKASIVECSLPECIGGGAIGSTAAAGSHDGIPLCLILSPAACSQPRAFCRTEHVGKRAFLARAQIDDPPARGMPRTTVWRVQIHAVFERQIRPGNVLHVDLGRCRGGWIGVAVFVRAQRPLLRMRARIRFGHARNDRVGKHHEAVARHDIAAVQSLAEQECVIERPVIVGRVQRVIPPRELCENQRNAAGSNLTVGAGHPERRIDRAKQKLRARRRRGRCAG